MVHRSRFRTALEPSAVAPEYQTQKPHQYQATAIPIISPDTTPQLLGYSRVAAREDLQALLNIVVTRRNPVHGYKGMCKHAQAYVHMHMELHMYIFHTRAHAHIHIHIHLHLHMRRHIHTPRYVHVRTHTHTYTYTCAHTCPCSCTCTCTCTSKAQQSPQSGHVNSANPNVSNFKSQEANVPDIHNPQLHKQNLSSIHLRRLRLCKSPKPVRINLRACIMFL